MQIITAREDRAFKAIVYGPAGVGKSTLAAHAPAPVFFDCERGLGRIDCHRTPPITSWQEWLSAASWFFVEDHPYRTAVIDTTDALEQLIHEHICQAHGKKHIEDFGWGKGFGMAVEEWLTLCRWADKCVDKNRNVILVAHDNVKTYQNPTSDSYDRISIKLNQRSANLVVGRMDAVLYAHWETVLRGDVKNTDRKFAVGTGRRMLQCIETPAVTAKNRFGLGVYEPMDPAIYKRMSA